MSAAAESPAVPRRAATVLVLRASPGPGRRPGEDVEVLLVRRSHRASFMASAYVFPGGRVDDADHAAAPAGDPLGAARVCAARELAEEARLVAADLSELVPFARWITPSAEPKRFDTEFFLWPLAPGQVPEVDAQEVFDLRWLSPAQALAEYGAGTLNLPPPTASTLEDLAAELARTRAGLAPGAAVLAALLHACRARKPRPILPKLTATAAGAIAIVMPWDAEFAALPGEGTPAPDLAEHAAPVPARIRRCLLVPPGSWQVERSPV